MRRRKPIEVPVVGLEHRPRSSAERDHHQTGITARPHWTNITLRTGILLGELFPQINFRKDYNNDEFLSRLYECFKTPLGLDKLRFDLSNRYRAEKEILYHIHYHFRKAFNVFEQDDYYHESDRYAFNVLWEMTEQPKAGFHAMYINDIYLTEYSLIQEILLYGMHFICWDICFGSWHFPYDTIEEIAIYAREELKQLQNIKEPNEDEITEIKTKQKELKLMEKEIQEYTEVVFDRSDGISLSAYQRLVRQLDIKRYPEVVQWANMIIRLVKKGIIVSSYVPYDPESTLTSAAERYYIALHPGYIADRYEETINVNAQENSCNLFRINTYTPSGVIKQPNINWKHVTEVLFGLDISKIARKTKCKPKPLIEIL